MKKTLLALFMAIVLLSACKKDPEDKLKGRWDVVKDYYVETINGVNGNEDSSTYAIGALYLVFDGNQYKIYDDGELEDSGTFSAANESITLTSSDGEVETMALRWNSKSEIVFTNEQTETAGGKTYVYKSETTLRKN